MDVYERIKCRDLLSVVSSPTEVVEKHIPRRVIVLDETCVKVNGLEYWVYAGC